MQDFHVRERKRIIDLYKTTKLFKSRNPSPVKPNENKLLAATLEPVTITAPEMANNFLGLNERIIFNRRIVKNLSTKELDNTKRKQIFMNPKLEHHEKMIKKRIEF